MEPNRESNEDHERNYRTIFESDMVGIIVTNLTGRIFDANDYFLRMVGYTKEDLQAGKLDWLKLTAPEYIELSKNIARDILENKKIKPFEKNMFIRMDIVCP